MNPLPDSARSPTTLDPNHSAPRCRSSEPEPSSSAASSASSPVRWHCLDKKARRSQDRESSQLALPDPVIGRQRVVRLYLALATACGFTITGLGVRSSRSALTTVSTGGFSDRADSSSLYWRAKVVATVFMLIGGLSFFVVLAAPGKPPSFRRVELRIYLGIIGVGPPFLREVDGLSVGDAPRRQVRRARPDSL